MNASPSAEPTEDAASVARPCFAHAIYRAFVSVLASLILVSAVFAIYSRVLYAPFIFDDHATILNNPSIVHLWPLVGSGRQGGPLNPPKDLPTSARPLVNLSLAINYRLGKHETAGYHAVNFAIHALSALLLWTIVRRTLLLDYFCGRFEGTANALAFAAALIWSVHPLNTESVAYVTQRTESMMGFFYLATFYASLRYWEAKTRKRRAAWLILATMTGVLGMVSKEMMASAIAMVLLFERTFVAGSFRRALKASWPLYLGLAVGWIPILAINLHGPRTPLAGFHLGIPAHIWWLTQAKVLLMFLKLALWPWPLVIHYEIPYLETLSAAWPWVLGATLLAIATLLLVWRRTAVGFVGAWVFAVLSPTLLIPLPGETMAERRMYVPLAAMAPLVIVGGFAMLQWLERRFAGGASRPRIALPATALAVIALTTIFSLVSFRRLAAYRDEFTIWQDAALYQPNDPLIQINLGTSLAANGLSREAIVYFEQALRLDPNHSHAHYNLARALAEVGQPAEALAHYEQAVRSEPKFADAQYNFALALREAGRTSEAIERFEAALQCRPDFAAAHNNLGVTLAGMGRTTDAIPHFEQAVKLEPDVESYANLAFACALAERRAETIVAVNKAIELAREQGKTALADELQAWSTAYRLRTERP